MQITIEVEPGHQAYYLAYHLSDLAADCSRRAWERFCETGEKETDPIWVQFTADAEFLWRISKAVGKVI